MASIAHNANALFLTLLMGLPLGAVPINELFIENFETPSVSGYSEGSTPAGWVRASQGFGGSRHGLNNADSGNWSTNTTSGQQVYSFRYTNSGLTSDEEVIGPLVLDATYTVTFDVVRDLVGASTGVTYTVQFMAFTLGTARDDCRSTPSGATILSSQSASAPSDGSWLTNRTITFYSDPATYAAWEGKDLAIRMRGSSTCANLDNFKVMDDIPPAGTVITLR